ncbi:hypothetical protein EDB80DRAFT_809947 [Ilyonectria destructans]|nr:hypothetical protein EDB80DRAFT_809947 [Ilyonectria destructans]
MASLQQLILLWKNNEFFPGEQSPATAVPKNANAREELFKEVVDDKDIVQDIRDGISLLHDACNAIETTQRFRKQPDFYNPNALVTYDFLLVAHVLRLFFPKKMMKELRKPDEDELNRIEEQWKDVRYCRFTEQNPFDAIYDISAKTTYNYFRWLLRHTSNLNSLDSLELYWKNFQLMHTRLTNMRIDPDVIRELAEEYGLSEIPFFEPAAGVKRSREDEEGSEGSSKKQKEFGSFKFDLSSFEPAAGVKRSREDREGSEGPSKKQKGPGSFKFEIPFFEPASGVKRSREDREGSGGPSKKQKEVGSFKFDLSSFEPVAGVKRSREDREGSEGPSKKQKEVGSFKFDLSSFEPVAGVKRSREDREGSGGPSKKQKEVGSFKFDLSSFEPAAGVKRSREDREGSEGPSKKQKEVGSFKFDLSSFGPAAGVKLSREDREGSGGSSKKQKSLSQNEGASFRFTFDGLKVKPEPKD